MEKAFPAATEPLSCKATGPEGQFGHPTGVLGRIVGRLMARKNGYINELAARLLVRECRGHVLEVGFGPGTLAETLARAGYRVTGVDVSAVMVAQARRRCRGLAGVDLRQGDATALPFAEGSFDGACSVNSVHHWPSVIAGLCEIRRVLRPGATLVLPLRMKADRPSRFQAPGYDEEGVAVVAAQLASSGFDEVRRESHALARRVVVLLARRADAERERP